MLTSPGYTLIETLDEGPFARMVRVLDQRDGRLVLLRMLRHDHPSAEAIASLQHEAAVCEGLEAEATLPLLRLERHQDLPVLVFEDPGGQTLSRRRQEFAADRERLLGLIGHAARALAALHRQGLLHNNLSPRCLLLAEDGAVRLLALEQAAPLGTPPPQTPEQRPLEDLLHLSPEASGRLQRTPDRRSDLYALGICLYDLLTGRTPFAASDPMAVIHGHLARSPEPPHQLEPGIPEALSALVLKLLAKQPEDRYQTIHGLLADLGECSSQWQRLGRIEPFALGSADRGDCLVIPQRLFGRATDRQRLLVRVEQALAGAVAMVGLSGAAGVGKSSLIASLRPALQHRRCLVAEGKCDQLGLNIPYAPLIQCFSALVRQVLSEDADALQVWHQRLQGALGGAAQLLVEVLPELGLILGPQPQPEPLPPLEAQNRFRQVVLRFLAVFAQPDHPLVLVLDDLQWADQGSLAILRDLLLREGLANLLVIAAWRDQELGPAHPLPAMLQQLASQAARLETIQLQPLQADDVNHLLAACFGCPAAECRELARRLQDTTGGNPFFINQLLQSLFREGHVRFDGQRWVWDLESIRAATFPDDVVSLVLDELKRLPAPVQRTLTLAACLGNRFDATALAMVGGQPGATVRRHLGAGEAANLVAPLVSSGSPDSAYRFLHDRIQQAAYAALADERERAAIHLRVGRRMLAGRDALAEGQLFDLVDHLNRGRLLIDDPQECLELAGLNLEAARRAKASVAYATALAYLEQGVDLLPPDGWREHHGLAYALHKDLLECQYLCGAIEPAQDTAAVLLRHVRDRLQLAEVQGLRMILCTALNRMAEVLELGYAALRELGLPMPAGPAAVQRAQRLETWRIQQLLLGRSIPALAQQPPLQDPLQQARLTLMAQMIPALYYLDMEASHLCYLRMARLSMQHGHAPVTAMAYLGLGRFLGEGRGRFLQRQQFGRVGLQLAEHYGSQALLCKAHFLYGGFIHAWSDSAVEATSHLQRAFEAGMASGDLVWACYANNVLCMQLVFLGRPYGEIEAESQRCLDHARQVGEHYTPVFFLITRQLARCLQGRTRGATDLSDAEFDELAQRTLLEQRPEFRVALHWYQLCKTQVLLQAGEHRQALAMVRAARSTRAAASGLLHAAEDDLLQALCLAAVLPQEGDPALRRLHRQGLRRLGRDLDGRARLCPANFRHRALLVQAETAWVDGRTAQAQALYGLAIQAALEAGHEPMAAYAHERAAALHRSLGDPVAARAHAEEARYRRERLGQLRGAGEQAASRQPVSGLLGRSLDLHSLIESMQALSREILLDRLLDRIVEILLANAGAERVVLILDAGEQALIQAEGSADPRQVEVLQARPLADSHDLPLSIVRMVRRLRRPVVLADAAAEGEFRHDPRVMAVGLRSVLCLPLTLQSQVLGVVYLENNLASDVFGSLRLETIEILGTQLAISLENARLYGEMARINRSYGRFIPHEFLSFLGRDSILDVELGDQILKRMTVLFADIRDFTAISERLTPKESFDFLNAYLRRVGPIIREHNGFIDKYIGDAVMALFPGSAADAVRAALAIQREVAAYNRDRGAVDGAPLRIGIGIHTGDLMLGTVGEEERMESTVISDAVNLADRVEDLTRIFGCRIALTADTLEDVTASLPVQVRSLGDLQVRGKSMPVKVLELIDDEGDPGGCASRRATLEWFETGVEAFHTGRFTTAAEAFAAVLREDPEDTVAAEFLRRCSDG